MKKLLLLILLLCCIVKINAQYEKHEISIGYGYGSSMQIIGMFNDIIVDGLSSIGSSKVKDRNKKYFGAFNVSYRYALSKKISLGGSLIYEYAKADAFVDKQNDGKFKRNYYTLAIETRFIYVKSDYIEVYGLAGLAFTLYNEKLILNESGEQDKKNKLLPFNCQLTPLGLKIGKKVGVFAELGLGYKGLLSAGAFARF